MDQVAAARLDDARHVFLDRDALIFYTSGIPKGCINDVRDLIQSISQQIWSLPGDTNGKRALQTTNFRIIAPGCAIRPWYDGATVVLTGRTFDPIKYLESHGRGRNVRTRSSACSAIRRPGDTRVRASR